MVLPDFPLLYSLILEAYSHSSPLAWHHTQTVGIISQGNLDVNITLWLLLNSYYFYLSFLEFEISHFSRHLYHTLFIYFLHLHHLLLIQFLSLFVGQWVWTFLWFSTPTQYFVDMSAFRHLNTFILCALSASCTNTQCSELWSNKNTTVLLVGGCLKFAILIAVLTCEIKSLLFQYALPWAPN